MENIVETLIRIKNSAHETNANDVVAACDNIFRKIVKALEAEIDEELNG